MYASGRSSSPDLTDCEEIPLNITKGNIELMGFSQEYMGLQQSCGMDTESTDTSIKQIKCDTALAVEHNSNYDIYDADGIKTNIHKVLNWSTPDKPSDTDISGCSLSHFSGQKSGNPGTNDDLIEALTDVILNQVTQLIENNVMNLRQNSGMTVPKYEDKAVQYKDEPCLLVQKSVQCDTSQNTTTHKAVQWEPQHEAIHIETDHCEEESTECSNLALTSNHENDDQHEHFSINQQELNTEITDCVKPLECMPHEGSPPSGGSGDTDMCKEDSKNNLSSSQANSHTASLVHRRESIPAVSLKTNSSSTNDHPSMFKSVSTYEGSKYHLTFSEMKNWRKTETTGTTPFPLPPLYRVHITPGNRDDHLEGDKKNQTASRQEEKQSNGGSSQYNSFSGRGQEPESVPKQRHSTEPGKTSSEKIILQDTNKTISTIKSPTGFDFSNIRTNVDSDTMSTAQNTSRQKEKNKTSDDQLTSKKTSIENRSVSVPTQPQVLKPKYDVFTNLLQEPSKHCSSTPLSKDHEPKVTSETNTNDHPHNTFKDKYFIKLGKKTSFTFKIHDKESHSNPMTGFACTASKNACEQESKDHTPTRHGETDSQSRSGDQMATQMRSPTFVLGNGSSQSLSFSANSKQQPEATSTPKPSEYCQAKSTENIVPQNKGKTPVAFNPLPNFSFTTNIKTNGSGSKKHHNTISQQKCNNNVSSTKTATHSTQTSMIKSAVPLEDKASSLSKLLSGFTFNAGINGCGKGNTPISQGENSQSGSGSKTAPQIISPAEDNKSATNINFTPHVNEDSKSEILAIPKTIAFGNGSSQSLSFSANSKQQPETASAPKPNEYCHENATESVLSQPEKTPVAFNKLSDFSFTTNIKTRDGDNNKHCNNISRQKCNDVFSTNNATHLTQTSTIKSSVPLGKKASFLSNPMTGFTFTAGMKGCGKENKDPKKARGDEMKLSRSQAATQIVPSGEDSKSRKILSFTPPANKDSNKSVVPKTFVFGTGSLQSICFSANKNQQADVPSVQKPSDHSQVISAVNISTANGSKVQKVQPSNKEPFTSKPLTGFPFTTDKNVCGQEDKNHTPTGQKEVNSKSGSGDQTNMAMSPGLLSKSTPAAHCTPSVNKDNKSGFPPIPKTFVFGKGSSQGISFCANKNLRDGSSEPKPSECSTEKSKANVLAQSGTMASGTYKPLISITLAYADKNECSSTTNTMQECKNTLSAGSQTISQTSGQNSKNTAMPNASVISDKGHKAEVPVISDTFTFKQLTIPSNTSESKCCLTESVPTVVPGKNKPKKSSRNSKMKAKRKSPFTLKPLTNFDFTSLSKNGSTGTDNKHFTPVQTPTGSTSADQEGRQCPSVQQDDKPILGISLTSNPDQKTAMSSISTKVTVGHDPAENISSAPLRNQESKTAADVGTPVRNNNLPSAIRKIRTKERELRIITRPSPRTNQTENHQTEVFLSADKLEAFRSAKFKTKRKPKRKECFHAKKIQRTTSDIDGNSESDTQKEYSLVSVRKSHAEASVVPPTFQKLSNDQNISKINTSTAAPELSIPRTTNTAVKPQPVPASSSEISRVNGMKSLDTGASAQNKGISQEPSKNVSAKNHSTSGVPVGSSAARSKETEVKPVRTFHTHVLCFADAGFLHTQFDWASDHLSQLQKMPLLPEYKPQFSAKTIVSLHVSFCFIKETVSCSADTTLGNALSYVKRDITPLHCEDNLFIYISQVNGQHYKLRSPMTLRALAGMCDADRPLEITILLYKYKAKQLLINHWADHREPRIG